jgi:Protein of unknown function (DUF3592)
MQVVLQTPTELVVHESRWPMIVMGALSTAFGGGAVWLRWTHPTGWSGNGGPWLVYLVGGVFLFIGLLILWNSADRRIVVDRSTKTVSVIVQRLVHRQTTLLPFADITDVALEQQAGTMSSGSNAASSPTWRVVFLMKDGSRTPWTPYLTSARITQETCAAAARVFGGWAGSAEHTPPASITSPSLISHPAATSWGCLAALFGIFIAIGLGIFSLQLYRMATYVPVGANVVSSGVREVPGNRGKSYAPDILYSYMWEGKMYSSRQVNPVQISAGRDWAGSTAQQYPAGAYVRAYVSPSQPSKSYLVQEASLMPLVFVFFPLAIGLLFVWIIRTQRAQVAYAEKHLVPVVGAA